MYHEQLVTLATYNGWANRRLFEAASALGPARFTQDRGVFFRSMSGTLNHLLATDRIWMRRFTGAGEAPSRLDAILFERFEPLREITTSGWSTDTASSPCRRIRSVAR